MRRARCENEEARGSTEWSEIDMIDDAAAAVRNDEIEDARAEAAEGPARPTGPSPVRLHGAGRITLTSKETPGECCAARRAALDRRLAVRFASRARGRPRDRPGK